MQPGSHFDAKIAHDVPDRGGAANRADRTVESGEEAVPGRVQFAAAEAIQLSTDERMMALEEVRPGSISQLCSFLRRADDVCEQDRCEHGLRLRRAPYARSEGDDLVREPVR